MDDDPLTPVYTDDSVDKRARKMRHEWTSKQKEQLIKAVRRRQSLWNPMYKEYKDRSVRDALWQDVADEVGLSRSIVAYKWKILRTSYIASYKSMETSGKSRKNLYAPNSTFRALRFLESTIRRDVASTTRKIDEDVEHVEIEEKRVSPSCSSPPSLQSQEEEEEEYVPRKHHDWTSQQREQLIKAVEMREGLWNHMCKDYKDRTLRYALWQDVANEMGLPRPVVAYKWKKLRTSYVATFKSMETGKSSKKLFTPKSTFAALKFLEPIIRYNLNKERTNTFKLSDFPLDDMFEVDCGVVKTEEVSHSPSFSHVYLSSPLPTSPTSSLLHFSPSPSPSPSPPPPHSPPPPSSPPTMPLKVRSAKKRRHKEHVNNHHGNMVECATQSMNHSTQNDAWDDLGRFVASSGREWADENLQMAKEFKIAISEVVLNFQKKFAWSQ